MGGPLGPRRSRFWDWGEATRIPGRGESATGRKYVAPTYSSSKCQEGYIGYLDTAISNVKDNLNKELSLYESRLKELEISPIKRSGSKSKLKKVIGKLEKLKEDVDSECRRTPSNVNCKSPYDIPYFNSQFEKDYPLTKSIYLDKVIWHEPLVPLSERLSKRLAVAEKLAHVKNLEGKAIVTTSLIGLVGGIFFLSANMTGNVIADLTTKTTSFLGAGLLIVGLVAGFFWIKSKK